MERGRALSLMPVAALLLAAAPAPVPAPAPAPAPEPAAAAREGSARHTRALSFAVALAARPLPTGWEGPGRAAEWKALARATPATRQDARWDHARGLIGRGMGAEADGVLQVMAEDDPDLEFVPAFRLARGAALVLARRAEEAGRHLSMPELAALPEACAWRLRAGEGDARPVLPAPDEAAALPTPPLMDCALPAITARAPAAGRPFRLMAAHAALKAGQPARAEALLQPLAAGDAAANLLRGEAMAGRDPAGAQFLLRRAATDGRGETQAAAQLALLKPKLLGSAPDAKALAALDHLLRSWRGGPVEREALLLANRLAVARGDVRTALESGEALLQFHAAGPETAALLAEVQALLGGLLAPGSRLPLDEAAGLIWEYRTLMPAGADGDRLARLLADRLEAAGLYGRAAELLRHQMVAAGADLPATVLSVRVATLYLRAGDPAQALRTLDQGAAQPMPAELVSQRDRVRAVALARIGRTAEALALLRQTPGGGALRAEILWQVRDLKAFAAETAEPRPAAGALTPERSTLLLRRAVALAELGRRDELAALARAHGNAFAGTPAGPVFAALTGPAGADPAALATAMAALPAASPAGELADLLEVPVAGPRLAAP